MLKIDGIDTRTQHKGDFIYEFPNGFDTWLLLMVHTPSIFIIDGIEQHFPKDCLVLFKPRMPISYKAHGDTYSDDWMHFIDTDKEINETLFPLGIPIQTPLADQCRSILTLLATENYLKNEYKDLTVHSLIHALLNKILEACHTRRLSPKQNTLIDLRKKIYRFPGEPWTLTTMAQEVYLSESHLQSLYKNTFNITCINDVIQARIQLAKSLLIYTDYTILYISTSCGYNSQQHFFRQFQNIVGCSPNKYRLNSRPHILE